MEKIKEKKEVCGFEYEGRKCKCTDIVGYARCVPLCEIHFNTVRSDNVRRFNKEMDIEKDMKFTKKLSYSETWSIFGGCLTNEKEVKNNGN